MSPLRSGLRRLQGATPENWCSAYTDDSTESSPRRLFPSVLPISLVILWSDSPIPNSRSRKGYLKWPSEREVEDEWGRAVWSLKGKETWLCVFTGLLFFIHPYFLKKIRTILEAYWSYYSFGWNNFFKKYYSSLEGLLQLLDYRKIIYILAELMRKNNRMKLLTMYFSSTWNKMIFLYSKFFRRCCLGSIHFLIKASISYYST